MVNGVNKAAITAKSVSSLTGNGLRDWLIQQLSAAFMAVYILGLIIYLVITPATDFYSWHALFNHSGMKIATFIFFVLLMVHAWIGLWTVATDYIKKTALRLPFLLLVRLILVACILWAAQILWG